MGARHSAVLTCRQVSDGALSLCGHAGGWGEETSPRPLSHGERGVGSEQRDEGRRRLGEDMRN
jgi:hypothetical protein